jgi:hypothetical protein
VVLALSHSLEILSEGGIHLIGNQLGPGTILWVFLSIQKPFWDVILSWSLKDIIDDLDLILLQLSTSDVHINLSNFKAKESKSSTNTSDLSQTERGLLFTVYVCVLHSQNMGEF